jgi:phosphatidate cytidylyltransferase
VADEKKGADDLFEDLDKFFAPIKDVDWPGSEDEGQKTSEAAEPVRSEEEHVKVHVSDPASREEPAPSKGSGSSSEGEIPPSPVGVGSTQDRPDDEEAAWYDTETLEADDIQMTPSEEEPSAEPREWKDVDDISSVRVEEPPPSDEEVEAAAEHFAESLRSEEQRSVETETSDAASETQVYAPDVLLGELEGDETEAAEDEDVDQILSGGGQRTVRVGAEGLGGPSWQEPTSVEVGAEVERDRADKEGLAPWITGGALLVVTFASLAIGAGASAVVATLMILVAQMELYSAMIKRHHRPATLIGLVAGAFMSVAAYLKGESGLLGMFAVGVVATFLWFLASAPQHRRDALTDLALTVLSLAFIPLLGGYLLVMLKAGATTSDATQGVHLVGLVIALVVVSDTVAFAVGSVWGGSWIRRSLAPSTSPKKSWEGFVVALIVTFIVAVAAGSYYGPLSGHKLDAALLGVVVCVAALFGDLAESLIKRDLRVKDMGNVLPGHGGVLDRVDSLLFAAPAAFLLLRVIFG